MTACAGLGVMIAAPRPVHAAFPVQDTERESRFRLRRFGVENTMKTVRKAPLETYGSLVGGGKNPISATLHDLRREHLS